MDGQLVICVSCTNKDLLINLNIKQLNKYIVLNKILTNKALTNKGDIKITRFLICTYLYKTHLANKCNSLM